MWALCFIGVVFRKNNIFKIGGLQMKYGLGWTKTVWDWYNEIWKKHARGGTGGLGGAIITFLAMIVMIIGVVLGAILDTIVEFINWLGGLFNDTDDDRARAEIRDMSCDQINALADERLNSMTQALLDGPTGDDDEKALIKIVECLGCDRLTGTYWPRFGSRIQDDTHGTEFDRLRVAMRRCRLVNFSDWDDDATRLFIRNSSCRDLQLLSMDEIKQLTRNMFSGFTGDADERMINKLIDCLDSDTVQRLVEERGFSVSDFNDEVDGSEWSQLVRIFRSKGVSV
jgi:DNA-directed RNA polymerase subunit N (RpoN/RPB10)